MRLLLFLRLLSTWLFLPGILAAVIATKEQNDSAVAKEEEEVIATKEQPDSAVAKEEEEEERGGGALLRPSSSRRLHHPRRRVVAAAENDDERCQIPTIDKPECVDNLEDFLEQMLDNITPVILICPGVTIVLESEDFVDDDGFPPSNPIISNKAIICDDSSQNDGGDDSCIIDGQELMSTFFVIEAMDIQVSLCRMTFLNFAIIPVIKNREGVLFASHCTFINSGLEVGRYDVEASLEIQQSTFTGGTADIYAFKMSTVFISNCKFMKGEAESLFLSESSVYIVDSDFVDNYSRVSPVIRMLTSELTLERCTFKNNISFFGAVELEPVDPGFVGPSKLILNGDQNKFINNRRHHIKVASTEGNEVSGCKSTTFIAPLQINGVVDELGRPVSC